MKNRRIMKGLISIALSMFIIISAVPFWANAATLTAAPEKDWTGYTPISNMQELNNIRKDPYGKYYLTCDIDVSNAASDIDYRGWPPIGQGYVELFNVNSKAAFNAAVEEYGMLYAMQGSGYVEMTEYSSSVYIYYYYEAFYGVFDGNGHSVKHLSFRDGKEANGLFGINYGVIHNVDVESYTISGYMNSGTVCGVNYGVITDCRAIRGDVYGYGFVGGICGVNYGLISGCDRASGKTNATVYSGGIVGLNCGYVQDCINYGTVSGNEYTGGIAGAAYYSSITECINKGSFDNETKTIGAIVGEEMDDGEACNMYRNCVYVASTISSVYKKGTAEQIGPSGNLFINTSANNFGSSSFYEGKLFDFDNKWYFDTQYSTPHPLGGLKKTGFRCSSVWDGTVASGFARGTGTKSDPYIIENAMQLAYLSRCVAKGESFAGAYIKLVKDIELNDTSLKYWFKNASEFMPVGNAENPFEGSFDGDGHKITGLYCDRADTLGTGLFGYILNGTVKDLNVEAYVKSPMFAGGICGVSDNAVISNCSVDGFVGGFAYIGAICGANYGEITRSDSMGKISSTYIGGGLCGENAGSISESSSSVKVLGTDEYQGGLCGENFGSISDSYSSGEVYGKMYIGGLCGLNYEGSIENCYSAAKASGWVNTASICGANELSGEYPEAGINNCYYLQGKATHFNNKVQNGIGSDTQSGTSADKKGVTVGCTAEALKKQNTFAGFDFEGVWTMEGESSYPYPELKEPRMVLVGDVNGDEVVNSIDSNLLKRNLADSSVEIDLEAADINGDGAINAVDSNLLKRMISGQN